MAEAEDLITDVARHATVYAQALWRRHRGPSDTAKVFTLGDVAQHLDLLIKAVFDTHYSLRVAQPPSPPTLLKKLLLRHEKPCRQRAVPATDGVSIWLPVNLGSDDGSLTLDRYKTLALQQAMRAQRGSATALSALDNPMQRSFYRLLEAWAADSDLVRLLPGLAPSIHGLRHHALMTRPPLQAFPVQRQPLENLLRLLLRSECGKPLEGLEIPAKTADSLQQSETLAQRLMSVEKQPRLDAHLLLLDAWTGDLREPSAGLKVSPLTGEIDNADTLPRSARLVRQPTAREARTDEDDDQEQGLWMVQPAEPLEKAEDPMGMQRPTDRDTDTPAADFAESLSELNEARLVVTAGRPKEVLLSDDPPQTRVQRGAQDIPGNAISYPEWDYRSQIYRDPGTTLQLCPAQEGPQQWVERTLEAHRPVLDAICRQFECLRAQRVRLRKQWEGDDIDLEAYIDGCAEARAGLSMPQALYQTQRRSRRDMAIMLLIDVSGSTDSWLSQHRRVIDVEREALLLVCLALESLGEPYSVLAFSGEGPQRVTIRTLKAFDERYSHEVGRRIAALEPERYTRAGAALRHASTLLMREPATHRLLLLLSDGKPNDVDQYEGRYGVEDMRQAVTEAKLQGIYPFCLTIDRQAANYLPAVFGSRQYALLHRPELLPSVLLDWIRRLVST
ncbi:nitric oxide reductase activation protein NorD [Pseudomonas sp. HLT2-19-2]